MNRSNQFTTLIDAIYDWSLFPEASGALVGQIARAFDAPIASLFYTDVGGRIGRLATHGQPPELLRDYDAYYYSKDLLSFDRKSTSIRAFSFASDPVIGRSEYYADFLRRMESDHCVLALVANDGQVRMQFGLGRSPLQNPFVESDIELVSAIIPHFRRAAALGDQLEAARARAASIESSLDLVGFGIIILDRIGSVRHVNLTAKRLLEQRGIRIRHGRIEMDGVQQQAKLDRIVAAALSDGADSASSTAQIAPTSHETPLTLVAVPLRQKEAHIHWKGLGAAAIFVIDPAASVKARADTLREVFGLTLQEANLTVELTKGRRLAEVASDLGIGLGTARFHLKNVFQKTQAHSQAELTYIVLTTTSGAFLA